MGWASGTDIAIDMIHAIQKDVPDKKVRRRIYRALIRSLENADWDTQDEACGIDPVFDLIIAKKYPPEE